MAKRFVLEGEWHGYSSRQDRIVHREVIGKGMAMRLEGYHRIVYTDGTTLGLRVRECKPREKVVTIAAYNSLIRDCLHYDVWSVAELVELRNKRREEAQARRVEIPSTV